MSLTDLRQHAERYRNLRDELRRRITEEKGKGATLSEIAAVVGLSRQRIHQILQEEENSE